MRIREIKYKEKFKDEKDLYPGEYIKDIAQKVIKNNNLKFDKFEKNFNFLAKEALSYSMDMIKSDLTKLGITHDSFVSEKSIVDSDGVINAIKQLKKNKNIEEGYLEPPKGEENRDLKKIKRLIFKSALFGDDTNRAYKRMMSLDIFC